VKGWHKKNNMNLQLSLITKWFEKTKSRIKPEDYREITSYWVRRFYDVKKIKEGDIFDFIEYLKNPSFYKESELSVLNRMNIFKKNFTTNTITLGYPKSTDTERILKYEHAGIEIRTGNPEWGAEEGKLYFVIKHGNQIL